MHVSASRTRVFAAAAIGCLVGMQGYCLADVVVANNSFEANTNPDPGYGTIASWSETTSNIGVSTKSQAFDNGNPIPDGNNVAFIQGAGSISQTLTGLTPGETYSVSYYYDERGEATDSQAYSTGSLGGGSWSAGPVTRTTNAFQHYVSGPQIATGTSATLTFSNDTGGPGVDDNSLLIDAVTVTRGVPNIADSGFEAPVEGKGGGYQADGNQFGSLATNPNGSWTFTGGAGILDRDSPFGNGAIEGNQAAIIQQTGSFAQTITGLIPGVTYSLSFLDEGRSVDHNNGGNVIGNPFMITLGDQTLTSGGQSTLTPTTTGYANYAQTTTDSFVADSPSAVLTFTGLDVGTDDVTSFFDDLHFNFVADVLPEPTTLSLLAPMAITLLRRRRRTSP